MSFRKLTILVISLLVMSSLAIYAQELPTATAEFSSNLDNLDGWTADSADGWSVASGVAYMNYLSDRNSGNKFYRRLVADGGGINGDFSLTAWIGFSLESSKTVDEAGNIIGFNGNVYRRSYAVGLYQDASNYLATVLYQGNGNGNGILSNGTWLFASHAGQGQTPAVQDIRPIKMERSGDVTTVWLDGDITYQGTDTTTAGQTMAGWAAVGTTGELGISVDKLTLSATVSSPPSWAGPTVVADAIFPLVEDTYVVRSTDGMSKAYAEGGSMAGEFFGSWKDEGAAEGNRSFNINAGQLNILGIDYAPQNTFESWVRLTPNSRYVWYWLISALELNEAWNRQRGGLIASAGETEGLMGLSFSWGMLESISAPDVMTIGQWHHVALVRDNDFTTLYVDFEEVGSGTNQWGELDLPNVSVTFGSNTDHDGATEFKDGGYIEVDQIALTSAVLDPADFKLADPAAVEAMTPPSGVDLPTATANFSDDLNSLSGWTVDSADGWSVANGYAMMNSAVAATGDWHRYYMMADDGGISGDFSMTANVGFNIEAYPYDTDEAGAVTGINWQGVYYRNLAVGLYQASGKYHYAAMRRSSGNNNGINANGAWLNNPWIGQGLGVEIHDVREIKIERSGLVTTVWTDGEILCQGTDTTSAGQTEAGWATVGTRGPTGLMVDKVVLSSTVSTPPAWEGPQVVTDAVFLLNEGSGYELWSTDGMSKATAEGVTTGDSRLASWLSEGVNDGNKSIKMNAGQLNLHGFVYGPTNTIEAWVRVYSTEGPVIHVMADGTAIDAALWRERGGLFLSAGTTEDMIGVEWNFAGASIAVADGLSKGVWHHVAVVRDNEFTTFYIDFEEVGSTENTYGDMSLPNMMVTVANNADHDWITSFTEDGLLDVDQFAVSSEALDPADFKLAEGVDGEATPPVDLPTATASASFDGSSVSGWTPDSANALVSENGVLRQAVLSNVKGGQWYLPSPAVWDAGEINGDYLITAKMGADVRMIKDEEAGSYPGGLWNYGASLAAPFVDGSTHIVFRNVMSWGGSYSIWKQAAEQSAFIASPYNYPAGVPGGANQGISEAVYAMRDVEMSRKGGVVTVKLDGEIVMQGADTTSLSPAIDAGWVAVSGKNGMGILVDQISISPSAPTIAQWNGPTSVTDFVLPLNEGSGHKISDAASGYFAFMSVGYPEGEYGMWYEDGAAAGNKSYGAKPGGLKMTRVTLGSNTTVEAWVKVPSTINENVTYLPVVYAMVNGFQVNADWQRERGALIAFAPDAGAGTLSMESSWDATGISGIDVSFDEWHHVAWVREGSFVTLYLDFAEAGAGELPKYGDASFDNCLLVVGQNGDQDQISVVTETPTIMVDQIAVSSEVLDGDSFKLLDPAAIEIGEGGGPVGVMCDFNGDGNKVITDVIALLIFMRNNPGDLGADFNADGKANITDAIAMLIAMRDGKCPDAAVSLAGAEDDYLLTSGQLEGISQDDIAYLEEILSQLNLTAEEEAAYRVALYGKSAGANLPKAFSLAQNSPNPFNPSTTISYTVAEGKTVSVSLNVYDLRGKLVRTLVNEVKEAGVYNVYWNGTDNSGRSISSGVYFYRIQAGEFQQTRKMVMLK